MSRNTLKINLAPSDLPLFLSRIDALGFPHHLALVEIDTLNRMTYRLIADADTCNETEIVLRPDGT